MPRRLKSSLAAAVAAALLALAPSAAAKPAWQLVYSEPNQGNVLVGLSAVDGSHAWAVGVSSSTGNSSPVGVLTTDGVTWLPMTLPPPSGGPMQITLYTALDFSSATQGWLQGVQAGIGGAKALLYATETGGVAWAQVFQATEPLTMLQALPTGELYGAGGATVVVSTDGVTYGEVSPPVPGGLGLTAVHMLNSGCGFLSAATADDAASAESAVLWSGDGAQSWEVRAQGLPARLGRMWFVSANLGWAAGTDGQGQGVVARTADGGRTWTLAALPDHPAIGAGTPVPVSSCQDVRFFDDLRGVALCLACTSNCEPGAQGDPSLLTVFVRSTDGGLTWIADPDYEPVMTAPPFGPLMKFSGMDAMAFPDPNVGFLAGQNNLILRYAAVDAEPAAWGPPSCDPGAGGAGGSSGAGGGHGAANGSDDDDAANKAGCGCALPGSVGTTQRAAVLALLGLLSAARRRRRVT